jgi:hypothetical protein
MNHDLLIKTTNRVAMYATAALIYWVFTFLTITVFDLKIFRERMTEIFFLSLLGIFAILGGAIILNVMSNLSKISTAVSPALEIVPVQSQGSKVRLIVLGLCFPLIVAVLFIGNNLSAERKKDLLIRAAVNLVSENQASLRILADYKFTSDYVKNTESTLNVLNKIDRSFPEVMVVFPDSIDGKNLYLGFGGRRYRDDDKKEIEKSTYIYSTSREEREYLEKVFTTDQTDFRFHAGKGNYQLYFPTLVAGKKLVLYFSDFQRYGKFGS